MLPKFKKNIHLIFIFIILFSLIFFYLSYNFSVKKERQIGNIINDKELLLKNIKLNIKNKETEIGKLNIKPLMFNYFSKENNYFFTSKISKTAINCNLHLDYINYKGLKKYLYGKIYLFNMAGSGNFLNIYNFIKTLEYKYKIVINNFILKKDKKNYFLTFYSKLRIYEIKKNYLTVPVTFSFLNKLNPPSIYQKNVNPFSFNILKKKTELTKKIEIKHKIIKPFKKVPSKIYIRKKILKKENNKTLFYALKLSKEHKININKSDKYNKEGIILFKNNRYNAALNKFKKSILLNPKNYIALSNTALDYYIKKNYNKAKFYIKKAIKLKNNKWQFYFILGLIYIKHNKLLLSKNNFKKAYLLDPQNKKLLYYINNY
ncbi:MAG: tetratricopeptide repeat protein [bacterium]